MRTASPKTPYRLFQRLYAFSPANPRSFCYSLTFLYLSKNGNAAPPSAASVYNHSFNLGTVLHFGIEALKPPAVIEIVLESYAHVIL